jgi:hypothetical protein
MREYCLALISCLLFSVACANSQPEPTPPPVAEDSFPPVAAEFEQFYREFGGRRLFGHPISELYALEDSPSMQYFQTMRLDYDIDPESTGANRVTIFPLGEWALSILDEPLDRVEADSGPSRYFAETGHSVQADFLAFYEAFHGEQLLGPPISELSSLNGQRVQFFKNARLDWHPELAPDEQVQLGPLGEMHFNATMTFAYRPALSKQVVPASSVTAVDVFPSVLYPALFKGDRQVLFLTVLSPEGHSVSGLTVQIDVSYGEHTDQMEIRLADSENQARTTIDTADIPPGEQVKILVSVISTAGELLGTSALTFVTWW